MHDPAVAGQPLKITVRLTGSGAGSVQLSASCDEDRSYHPLPIETRELAPGIREGDLLYAVPKNATDYMRFRVQIVDNGVGKDQDDFFVKVYSTPPATMPASAPATAPVTAAPVVVAATAQPAAPAATPAAGIAQPPVFLAETPATPTQPVTIAPTPAPAVTPMPVAPVATPAVTPPPITILPTQSATSPIAATQPASAPATQAMGPDLAVTFIDAPPEILGAPAEIRALRYRVVNNGSAPSTGTWVKYGSELQSASNRYDQPLEPGGELYGIVEFELDPDISSFWVEVLARNATDPNPANNRDVRSVRMAAASPDEVLIEEMTFARPPQTIQAGDLLEVRLIVKNPGPSSIAQAFEVAIDGFAEGRVRQTIQPPFAYGSSMILTVRGSAPGPEKQRALTAIADSTNLLVERNESDNFATLSLSPSTSPVEPSAPGVAGVAPTPYAPTLEPIAPTPTPSVAEQDLQIKSLEVLPQRPVAGNPVVFIITVNQRTVYDQQGKPYEVTDYIKLDPRGDGIEQTPFVYNSSMPNGNGGAWHRLVATYTYDELDQGLERHAKILYSPPPNVSDADSANNQATGIVQIGR